MDKGDPAIEYIIFRFPIPCLPCGICRTSDIKVINHKLEWDGKERLG
jgi:hypothetical protein